MNRTLALCVFVVYPLSAARAQTRLPDFIVPLEEGRAVVERAQALAADVMTPEQARALLKAKLAGSAVPAAYVDQVLDDPRLKVYPDIAGRFGGGHPTAAEAPYESYRKYFLTEERIAEGARFLRDHAKLLEAVRARTGVDGALLVALAGVETFYGTRAGTYAVFDAVYTIMLKVPARSAWAADEAAEFLKIAHAQGLDAHGVLGSYAGAFGYVQFEPSSYNRYAVDFDGDGRVRLDEWPDALGSAGHYLALAGYQAGAPFTPASPIGRSLHAYNHHENYVRVVLDLRAEILKRTP